MVGAVAAASVLLASSVLASGMRGCRGSDDGRVGRSIALKHGVEESGLFGEESSAVTVRVPGERTHGVVT